MKRWSTMSDRAKAITLTLACVQVSLAVTAWVDLARRPADAVVGAKAWWAAAIAVNFVGPIAYFTVGRRPPRTATLL